MPIRGDRNLLVALLVAAFVAAPVAGEEAVVKSTDASDIEAEAIASADPHHRLDFGLEKFGSDERDIKTFSLGYTWAPGQQHALNINVDIVDSRLGDVEGDGLSDSVVTYSWAPSEKVTAKPWLPRRFGTGLSLVVPTGDLLEGTGSDMWIAAPFVGWPVTIGKGITLLPSLAYLRSFSEGDLSIPIEGLSLELGLVSAIGPKWWITLLPAVTEELVLHETIFSISAQVGREFGTRHGISIEYGYVDDDTISVALGLGSDFNEKIAVRGHLGFR